MELGFLDLSRVSWLIISRRLCQHLSAITHATFVLIDVNPVPRRHSRGIRALLFGDETHSFPASPRTTPVEPWYGVHRQSFLWSVVNGGHVSISGARIVLDDPVSSRSSAEMEPIHLT